MKESGEESATIEARSSLLNAIEALRVHSASLVLVGAQAIYIHTQHLSLPLAPATTDSDIVINGPKLLGYPITGFRLPDNHLAWSPH